MPPTCCAGSPASRDKGLPTKEKPHVLRAHGGVSPWGSSSPPPLTLLAVVIGVKPPRVGAAKEWKHSSSGGNGGLC